jgi:hypothetical protein
MNGENRPYQFYLFDHRSESRFPFLVGTFLALLNILKNKINKTVSILFGAGYEA